MKLKKSKRDIHFLVVHCSATPECREHSAKDIDRWHRNRGFKEIGYNYVIKLNGAVELGRDVDKIPAHVENNNKHSIGICYIGGVDKDSLKPKDTRTKEQKDSLTKLLFELKSLYPNAVILGHRDFKGVKKACPCFDAKKEYKDIK